MFQPELVDRIRQQNPLIHNLTNIVVANYVANGLLALGASPIMSNAPQEMEALAEIVSAIAINIGTPTTEQIEAMMIAGQAANRLNKAVILDPVGVGATPYRRQIVHRLLENIQFSAIRGNAGELATLAGIAWQSKGVDAGQGDGDLQHIAETVARRYQTIAVLSGETDIVSDGTRTVAIHGGTPLFPTITGSGCLHGAICAAFIAVADDTFTACATACHAYGRAGELSATPDMRSGTFTTALLDGISRLSSSDLRNA